MSLKFLNWLLKRKSVPFSITCPACFGKGNAYLHRRGDAKPDPLDIVTKCPICKGTGKVPHYINKEDNHGSHRPA